MTMRVPSSVRRPRAPRGLILAAALLLPSLPVAAIPVVPPVPLIQAVSPASAQTPASGDVTLTLTGSGFSDGNFTPPSTVEFDGPNGTVTIPTMACDSGPDAGKTCTTNSDCASPGVCKTRATLCQVIPQTLGVCAELTVTIPQADLVTGTATIRVLNPFPAANPQPPPVASNPVSFPMAALEAETFFGNASVSAGNGPQGLAGGDFNGDGIQDLAVVNSSDNSVSILLGHGDGTFAPATGSPIVLGNNLGPVAIAMGDFNNDGLQDLAVANEDENTISVLTGNGDGTFALGVTRFGTSGLTPVALATIDLDGDGNLDLAVVNQTNHQPAGCKPGDSNCPCGSNGSLALLLGDGSGGFSLLPASSTSSYTGESSLVSVNPMCMGASASSVAVGDVNGDGMPDMVVTSGDAGSATCNQGVGSVAIVLNHTTFLNTCSGLCLPPVSPSPASYCAGKTPRGVAVGDFNNDAKLDLAVADFGNSEVAILLGNGDGTFPNAPTAPLGFSTGSSGPIGVIVGDFDSDQKPDLAVLHSGAVAILRGDNTGNFTADGGSSVVGALAGFVVADFNGDGRLDIAATNSPNAVTIMSQNPPLRFSPDHLGFGDVPQGASSAPQTITITNNSAASLTLSTGSITIAGQNASSFTRVAAAANECGSSPTLAGGGGQCNIAVVFAPNTVGTVAASVQVNEPTGISQSVLLKGNGLAPVLSANPLNVTFGGTLIGTTNPAPVTVTISNIGTAGASITGVTIGGTNAADFLPADACTGSSLTAGSGTCTIGVTFAPAFPPPSGAGLRSAQITVTYTINGVAGSFTLSVGLAGTARAPLVSLSVASLTFSNQQVGTTSLPAPVSLTNLGSWPLTINAVNGIVIGGPNAADFSIQSTNCPVSPNMLPDSGACVVNVLFAPVPMNPPVGPRSATLTFTDNNNALNNSTQTVNLTATATAPVASLSSSTLAFGGVPIGTTSAPASFLLLNAGTAPLALRMVNGIAIGGANAPDFNETDNCPRAPSTLAVNANCTVTVTLKPSAALARSAALTITDNNLDSPTNTTFTQVVALGGAGTDFTIAVAPPAVSVSPGKFATYTLTITPIDGFSGTLSLACNVAPPAPKGTCTVPNFVVVNGTTTVTSITSKNAAKGTYTLTYAGTFTATAPASGTLQHATTATLTVK
jgi:hypothetical protein